MSYNEFKIERRVILVGLLVTACGGGGGGGMSGGGGKGAKATYEGGETFQTNAEGIPEMNKLRAQVGAGPLSESEVCTQAALQQAHFIARTGHVDHWVPGVGELGDIATRLKYFAVPKPHGENISWGYRNAPRAVAGWYSSPPHRKTMLSKKYNRVGMAGATHPNTGNKLYWASVYSV